MAGASEMDVNDKGVAVGIAGAGAIAFGAAAFLESAGHRPILWSPSGEGTKRLAAGEKLVAKGAVEGTFRPGVASSAKDLAERTDVLMIALPAYGHKSVMDAVAPHIRSDHVVLISSHASFGALYLSRLLARRGIVVPIVAWGTTVTTGRRPSPVEASVNTVRSKVDICTVPAARSAEGLAVCRKLFGDRFVEREGLLALALSNLNPQNHLGIALCNMTRMEHGESWGQGLNVTPNVGRLLEALDRERLAIAEVLGLSVRTIFEHFHLSFHVPVDNISNMNQQMHREGRGGVGPATADSRYVTEDVPYGLLATVKLGALTGRPAKLHRAGIEIFSALYGRDFFSENQLLGALDLDSMSLDELKMLSRDGYAAAARRPAET
ncbi:coenzyme 420-dependent octopine/nopaline dehydrogenase [Mesorhizobium alhagi CCNWXJ12-2]|jgi:opine dehydrogenase|uniref:2-dehydropantoate 2-reductase n=1 Tax=Mesorhizobium alhagi CCNWXJ12-2 TaxID=1107882 RepID=H0HU94_9HYPH|nr:coenzyme 420-dependent octopine/nopaline dehydrogenase [Mesorhizobium alhagi CCNWXJ12-2]